MPAIAPIVAVGEDVYDYTFSPQQINGPVATYLDTRGGVSVGMPKLTASLTRPSKQSRNSRVRVRLVQPVLNDDETLSHESYADVTFTFNEKSTLLQRQGVVEGFLDILGSQTMASLSEELEMLY